MANTDSYKKHLEIASPKLAMTISYVTARSISSVAVSTFLTLSITSKALFRQCLFSYLQPCKQYQK